MNNIHSQLNISKALQTCTPCCPFDINNLPHPQVDLPSTNIFDIQQRKGTMINSDLCCLSRLQVECRIQYPKKKNKQKKSKKNKRLNSMHSYLSTKRSLSSANQSNLNEKRKKLDSSSILNYDLDTSSSLSASSLNTTPSNLSQQSYSSNGSKRKFTYQNKSSNAQRYNSQMNINKNIQNLKNSIENLKQLILQQSSPKSNSLFTKIRQFLLSFPFPFKSSDNRIDHECNEILQHHHLTRQDLYEIYEIFNQNDLIFLNWLRSFIPEYYLPFFLNYVKHVHSISTDNK